MTKGKDITPDQFDEVLRIINILKGYMNEDTPGSYAAIIALAANLPGPYKGMDLTAFTGPARTALDL